MAAGPRGRGRNKHLSKQAAPGPCGVSAPVRGGIASARSRRRDTCCECAFSAVASFVWCAPVHTGVDRCGTQPEGGEAGKADDGSNYK